MAILLNDDQIAQLKVSLPVLRSSGANKCIPIAVGQATISGTTAVIALANVVATDTPIVSGVDTTTAALSAVCTAGVLTITGTDTEVVAYAVYRA